MKQPLRFIEVWISIENRDYKARKSTKTWLEAHLVISLQGKYIKLHKTKLNPQKA